MIQIRRFLLLGVFTALTSCGYDGGYRYECQDPENWKSEECNPPFCNVNGDCTETLLGFNPNTTELPVETVPTETTEETVAP